MKGQPINYSSQELAYIKTNKTMPRKALCKAFNHHFSRSVKEQNIKSLCLRNKWLTGRTGQYKKGNIPHPMAGANGPNSSSFKKGERPRNWRPVGSTRISKDSYLEIKIAEPKTWQAVHICKWEKANGKVPKGHKVSFIDGDKSNSELTNLELLSDNEMLQINRISLKNKPAELHQAIRTTGKLIAKTQQRAAP